MGSRRELARQLGALEGFEDPDVTLEQYATPPSVASHVIHRADLQGDLTGRTVVDLGTGTGVLALATALRGAGRVVAIDVDRDPLTTAIANQRRLQLVTDVHWILADVTRPPIRIEDPAETTVITNPPFGAQHGAAGADRTFLETARRLASVSYSIHNAGSRPFVESYAADYGGTVTHAFQAEFDIEAQFDFHDHDRTAIDVEVYRIEWPVDDTT